MADKLRTLSDDFPVLFPDQIPLGEIRGWISTHAPDGCWCPACGQIVRVWRRPITAVSAASLINLVSLWVRSGRHGWIHKDDFLVTPKDTNFAALCKWGLVETMPNSDEAKHSSGKYRPTPLGEAFAYRQAKVRKYVRTLNGDVVGFEGDEISIDEALKSRFSYSALMEINSRGHRVTLEILAARERACLAS